MSGLRSVRFVDPRDSRVIALDLPEAAVARAPVTESAEVVLSYRIRLEAPMIRCEPSDTLTAVTQGYDRHGNPVDDQRSMSMSLRRSGIVPTTSRSDDRLERRRISARW